MISVIIPTRNAAPSLIGNLNALIPALVDGIVREAIVVDGCSSDATLEIAELAGTKVVQTAPGRGSQLSMGARHAKANWLLFLHADTVLSSGWEQEVASFIARVENGDLPPSAAAFRFRLNDLGFRPRLLEVMVAMRCALFRLPYGDQGLLIPRRLYDHVGGYRELPLMEDVDLVRRLGRRHIRMLRTYAVTSAERYKRDGYAKRALRNLACLSLYYLRVPPRTLVRLYG